MGTLAVMTSARIDRLLGPEYLGDVASRSMEEIRAMREECQQAEVGLSYLRRLAQGRLDIAAAELRRRSEGADPSQVADLVAQLPEILGRQVVSPGPGRLPTYLAPADDADLTAELDAVADPAGLASLVELDDEKVRGLADHLAALEASISARRRALHERIDVLQAELVRRYKSGEASVDSLLP